ncbi:LytTR family DNA-binding domain-containing protein [Lysinibacillus sp. KU-BSD001]|uniref:LytR/AlgR family response regulator transcription factor n=1 Tax=Lysinibacillus sp. KU-BSD001 TaxID=3141328 RepID=UPI0036E0318A
MRVAICEDETFHRACILKAIQNYALFQAPSIEVVLCTNDPHELLQQRKSIHIDCYLLDIELGSTINGLDVAKRIREQDPLAHIIFITTYADRLSLTFKYKLAALDFIVKDSPEQIALGVIEALQAALMKYKQLGNTDSTKWFQIKVGEKVKNIRLKDIYFFETSTQPHKLELHERNGYHTFYGTLKELDHLGEHFFRCHKSYLINLENVKELNIKERYVTMENGRNCPIAFRLLGKLQKRLQLFQ